jgi:carbonic anhydrase
MRRTLIFIVTLLVSLSVAAQQPAPQKQPPQQTQPQITPDALWDALAQGNKQFVAGTVAYNLLKEEREQLRDRQSPPVSILSCSDSRVPPELVFNQSLGALFVVRTAGNVADEFGLASLEYAVSQGYTKLIVVLGHERCGAVSASLGGADPSTPALTRLAERIRSSFVGIPYDSRSAVNVQRAVEANARAAAAQLLASSKLLRDAVLTEQVKIVTAVYDLDTGEVKKID